MRTYEPPIHQLTLSGCLNRTMIPSSNLCAIYFVRLGGGIGIIFVLVTQNIGGAHAPSAPSPPPPPQFLHLCADEGWTKRTFLKREDNRAILPGTYSTTPEL